MTYRVVLPRLIAPTAATPDHPPVVELKTLADVRDLVDRHLPAQRYARAHARVRVTVERREPVTTRHPGR